MDLLQSVRKEGSRGGRAEFSWEEVKSNSHRENYLGHSLMAPVGRWQKNKDLSWYARADGEGANQMSVEEERKAEIRRVKEAEEQALAKALGYEVPERKTSENANLTALGPSRDVRRQVKESVDEGLEGDDGGKGLGFGGYSGDAKIGAGEDDEDRDVLEGTRMPDPRRGAVDGRRRDGEERHGRDGDERRRRRRDEDRDSHRRRRRSRSKSREGDSGKRYRERARRRSRSRSYDRRSHARGSERHGRERGYEKRSNARDDGRARYDEESHGSRHRRRSRSPDEGGRHERRDHRQYD